MINRMKFASLALAGFLVVGCNKNDQTPASNAATGTSNAASDATSGAKDALNSAIIGTSNAVGDIKDKASAAGSSLSNAIGDAKDKATNAASSTTAPSGSSLIDTAKAKLQQVQDYISQGKLDSADSVLKDLEGMKSSLPDSMQQEITALRTKLDSAKNALGGMSAPSLPGAK